MNFKSINNGGDIAGYVVNSPNEEAANKMANKLFEYHNHLEPIEFEKPIPSMFVNCAMDVITLNNFQKDTDK